MDQYSGIRYDSNRDKSTILDPNNNTKYNTDFMNHKTKKVYYLHNIIS